MPANRRRAFAQLMDLDVPVHGRGLGGPDQPLQLGAAVVLGLRRQFRDVDIGSEQVEAAHLVGVDGQNLDSALLVWQTWGSREPSRWFKYEC